MFFCICFVIKGITMTPCQNILRTISNIKFSTLHDLRVINFSWNQIDEIPEEISKLPLLEHLFLSHNSIVSLVGI